MEPILICAIVFVGLMVYMLSRPKTRQPNPLKLSSHKLRDVSPSGKSIKQLNVIFQYNGHDFDAFEALGLPAGSNFERVQEAFQKAKNEADPEAHAFLEQAFDSIRRSMPQ